MPLFGRHPDSFHGRTNRGRWMTRHERVETESGTDRHPAPRKCRHGLVADLPQAAVGDAGAVLDAVDTRVEGLLHGGCPVGMGCDAQAVAVCCVDDPA